MPTAQAGMGGGGVALEDDAEILRRYRGKRNGVLGRIAVGELGHQRGNSARRRWPRGSSPGAPIPAISAAIQSGSLVTKVMARMVCGDGNSY